MAQELDQSLINQWKNEYGEIFSLSTKGGDFVVRPLVLSEYEYMMDSEASSAEIEEALVQAALLYPTDINVDQMSAGIFTKLAEAVLSLSGFMDHHHAVRILAEQREKTQSVYGLMKAMIITTMPMYTEEDLDGMTFRQLAAKVALAERIIEVHQAIGGGGPVTLELVDPEEEAKQAELEKHKHAATKKQGQAGYEDPIAQKLRMAMGG